MIRVALKSVLARKRRLFTTGFAIVLSVAFISGTLVTTALISSTLDTLIGSIYRGVDVVVRSNQVQESHFGTPIRDPIPDRSLDQIQTIPAVRMAAGYVVGYATMLDTSGERIQDTFGPPTLALNWIDDELLQGGRIQEGRAPVAADEVVIGISTAEEYDFSVGDQIQVQFSGGLETLNIVGLEGIPVDGGDELVNGAPVVILEEHAAQQLLNRPNSYDYIAVAGEDGVSQNELLTAILPTLGSDQEAITGEAFIEESQASVSQIISLFSTPILAFGYISAFVGAFVIYNTFSIVVAQRTRELALLRAVGAGRRQILGSVMLEAAVIGLVASALGVIGGWLLAIVLKGALASAFSLPEGIPPLTFNAVWIALLIGVGSTVVSALVPGVRATLIPPVAALGETAIDRSALSVFRKVAGTVLTILSVGLIALVSNGTLDLGVGGIGIGAALLFVGLATLGPVFAGPLARTLGAPLPRLRGVAGRIGKENAGRNPKRTTITAIALSIGVSLVTVVSIFAVSIRGATESQLENELSTIDLVIGAGTGNAGLGPEAREYLESRPEVAEINPVRYNLMTLLNSKEALEEQKTEGLDRDGVPVGDSEFLVGVDPTAVFKVIKFDNLTPDIDTLADDEVLVLTKTAEKNGWVAGDIVELWFPSSGKQTWTIAATFDTRVASAEYISNLDTLNANAVPDFQVDAFIWLQLANGLSPQAGIDLLEDDLRKVSPTASISTIEDFVGERLAIVDSVVNLIYVLLGLSIVVALVGVGNTISLSIHERTRELGLLRAVGMGRRQLGESVGWESIIIALAGTVVGLTVGISLAIIFIRALDEPGISPMVSVTSMVVIGLLGALAGVVTAIRPAWRATKVDILDAISTV